MIQDMSANLSLTTKTKSTTTGGNLSCGDHLSAKRSAKVTVCERQCTVSSVNTGGQGEYLVKLVHV